MQLSAIPTKAIDVADFPLKDSQSRRIFILIDGKRSLKQIFDLLKVEIQDGLELIGMMVEKGYLRLLNDGSTASQVSNNEQISINGLSQSISTEVFISTVSGELAKFVGPVASIIMGDFELEGDKVDMDTCKKIISTVSSEIDDLDDKRSFLEAIQDRMNSLS